MNSQVIQVAIGVVAAFFFVALISSGVVEVIAKIMKKRASDLEATLKQLLGSKDVVAALKSTSVYQALQGGTSGSSSADPGTLKDTKPSYMPARSFADATIEMLAALKASATTNAAQANAVINAIADAPLGQRLRAIEVEIGDDLTAAKANLETWFDGSMQRLQGAYTRWAKLILGIVGLILAVVLNISATTLVTKLWNDPVAREAAVTAVSSNATTTAESTPATPSDPEAIAKQLKDLDSLQLPIGWGMPSPDSFSAWVVVVVGWIITGFAAVVGAPYWFDLLRRLTTFAGVSPGGKPLPAAQDPQSSVNAVSATSGKIASGGPADVFGTSYLPTLPNKPPRRPEGGA